MAHEENSGGTASRGTTVRRPAKQRSGGTARRRPAEEEESG
jgi:hypothetical protein